MIDERIYILDLMNMQLSESIDNTDIVENSRKFDRLCHACKIDIIPEYKETISGIYVVNVALECLRYGMGNGIWPKGISHAFIPIINKKIKKDYDIKYIGKKLIEKTRREIAMVRGLIEANMRKYERIIENAGEMDIYSLDHAWADIDRTIGYIRKIIIMIPSMLNKIEEKIEEEKKTQWKKK